MVNQVPDVWRHVHTLLSKNLRREGEKELRKQIRSLLCPGLKADPLPHTHFRQIPLTNVSRKSSSPTACRETSPLYSFEYHLCGPQVRCEREKPGSSSFYSSHWIVILNLPSLLPSPLLHDPKVQLPSSWAQTRTNYNLNARGVLLF